MKKILLFFCLALAYSAFTQGTTQRIALLNLQKANIVESSRAGQIGLTDSQGNQRYAQYTEIDLVPIAYTPTTTGNTQNYSEFVTTASGDIWYIDWQGRGIRLYTEASAAAGDYDWLEIGNNQIPNSIRDSIYTDNYAAVNLRYVWPSAQFLVGDSLQAGNIVALGNRESRIGFYRLTGPTWSSVGQEGGALTARLGTGTSAFVVQSSGGTGPTAAGAPFRNIVTINTDSTIQFLDYPKTRNDTAAIANFLYTDSQGFLKSGLVSELPSGGGGGNVGYVPDSTAFRSYSGSATTLILSDTARGGLFRPCAPCLADQYMVYADGLNRNWIRFGYDRILASWWGNYGAVSLQRGVNYVGGVASYTQGRLYINHPILLKDTISMPEGMQIIGISPVSNIGYNGLDAPQKNKVTVDLNNWTKNAFSYVENARGYSSATAVSNLIIEVLSPCNAVIIMREPYKGTCEDLYIGPYYTTGVSQRFNYGILTKSSVVTEINRVRIQGAAISAMGDYSGQFGGGTFKIADSYFTRSKRGLYFPAGTSFWGENLAFENITDTVIYTTSTGSLSNSYTENAPLSANGRFLVQGPDAYEFTFRNVTINAGGDCATGDCWVLEGGSRQTVFDDVFVNNFYGLIDTLHQYSNVIITKVMHLGMTDTANYMLDGRVRKEIFYALSGGNLAGSVDNVNQTLRVKSLMDNTGSKGISGQYLRSNGNNWTWANILPSQLAQDGANADDVLTWDGAGWYPLPLPVTPSIPGGTAGQLLRYTGSSTVGGEANLFWDAVNNRLGIGTTAPTALLHVSGNADFVGPSSRTVNIARNGGSNLQLISSTTASVIGTSTNTNLEIKTNNITRFTVDATGVMKFGPVEIKGSNNSSSTFGLKLFDNVNVQRFTFSDFGNLHMGLGATDGTKYINIVPDGTNSLFSVSTTGVIKSATLAGTGTRLVVANSTGEQSTADIATIVPDATTTTTGIVQLAGDLSGTATSPQIAANTIGDPEMQNASIQPAKFANISGMNTQGFAPWWNGTSWQYSDPNTLGYFVLNSTGTVSISSSRKNTVINPGSTQAAMTVNLHPAGTPADGQIVEVTFADEITALTISSNGAAAVLGAPVTTLPGRTYTFKFYGGLGANGTWILQQ